MSFNDSSSTILIFVVCFLQFLQSKLKAHIISFRKVSIAALYLLAIGTSTYYVIFAHDFLKTDVNVKGNGLTGASSLMEVKVGGNVKSEVGTTPIKTSVDVAQSSSSYINVTNREIPRIENVIPSIDEIQKILMEEHELLFLHDHNNAGATSTLAIQNKTKEEEHFLALARTYHLTYIFVQAFQSQNIPIFLAFGSHLGARRHHGIIPFNEKDVDLAIFSLDETKVKSTIQGALAQHGIDLEVNGPKEAPDNFGFDIKESSYSYSSHYFDFWLFHQDGANQIQCVGTNGNGCLKWYDWYHGHGTRPTFSKSDFFPPKYQVFGTHKVPIPSRPTDLETAQYGKEKDWNTICGGHRHWTGSQWATVPKKDRLCERLYDKYPFVFQGDNGVEVLRQGSVTMHTTSSITS